MTANCKTDKTNTMSIHGAEYNVEHVAIFVTVIDIAMVIVYWFALIFAKEMLATSEDYVRSETLTGADYTLKVKVESYVDRTREINSIYWFWAENILNREPYNLRDSYTNLIDVNQNFLVNVRRGLNNYGWIKMYDAMAKLLTQKKRLGRQHTRIKADID